MAFETNSNAKRSGSRSRTPRPTTPLRPSSRSSFRDSVRTAGGGDAPFPLNTFEPAFAELSDAMADLEANMMHFQLMHESLARFSESFASFLYGLNMNAFCVDFPEVLPGCQSRFHYIAFVPNNFVLQAPILESFRCNGQQDNQLPETPKAETDPEITFMSVLPLSIRQHSRLSAKPPWPIIINLATGLLKYPSLITLPHQIRQKYELCSKDNANRACRLHEVAQVGDELQLVLEVDQAGLLEREAGGQGD